MKMDSKMDCHALQGKARNDKFFYLADHLRQEQTNGFVKFCNKRGIVLKKVKCERYPKQRWVYQITRAELIRFIEIAEQAIARTHYLYVDSPIGLRATLKQLKGLI